jgi:hypothetical protein
MPLYTSFEALSHDGTVSSSADGSLAVSIASRAMHLVPKPYPKDPVFMRHILMDRPHVTLLTDAVFYEEKPVVTLVDAVRLYSTGAQFHGLTASQFIRHVVQHIADDVQQLHMRGYSHPSFLTIAQYSHAPVWVIGSDSILSSVTDAHRHRDLVNMAHVTDQLVEALLPPESILSFRTNQSRPCTFKDVMNADRLSLFPPGQTLDAWKKYGFIE